VEIDRRESKVRGSSKQRAVPARLVETHGKELFPPEFRNGYELVDGLFVHAHGVIEGELITGHALVDVTRAAHARNVGDSRERGAVNSQRRSAMKWDRASTAALEVILSIDTLVSLVSELRESKEAAGGITPIAQDTPLPLVGVTLVWGLAGARGS